MSRHFNCWEGLAMFLGDFSDTKSIVKEIHDKGGILFIQSLRVNRKIFKGDSFYCHFCKKTFKKKKRVWMITNLTGATVAFEDTFSSEKRAERAIFFLSYIYNEFEKYLGVEDENLELTEDDLRDPLLQDDDESPEDFEKRINEHIEELKEGFLLIKEDDEDVY